MPSFSVVRKHMLGKDNPHVITLTSIDSSVYFEASGKTKHDADMQLRKSVDSNLSSAQDKLVWAKKDVSEAENYKDALYGYFEEERRNGEEESSNKPDENVGRKGGDTAQGITSYQPEPEDPSDLS